MINILFLLVGVYLGTLLNEEKVAQQKEEIKKMLRSNKAVIISPVQKQKIEQALNELKNNEEM